MDLSRPREKSGAGCALGVAEILSISFAVSVSDGGLQETKGSRQT